MSRVTPLKIFDENSAQAPSLTGLGKRKGGVAQVLDDPPVKKGLQQSVVKSARKALANLSSSEINIRKTPAASLKSKSAIAVKSTGKAPVKVLNEFFVDDFQPDEMLCTRLQEPDGVDYHRQHGAVGTGDIDFNGTNPDWAEGGALLDSPSLCNASALEDESTEYLVAQLTAPMLDFDGKA